MKIKVQECTLLEAIKRDSSRYKTRDQLNEEIDQVLSGTLGRVKLTMAECHPGLRSNNACDRIYERHSRQLGE
jgi:hypothetical protein